MKHGLCLWCIVALPLVVCSCQGVPDGLWGRPTTMDLISNQENTVFEIKPLGGTERQLVGKGKWVTTNVDRSTAYEVFATPEGYVTKSITTAIPPNRTIQFVFYLADRKDHQSPAETWPEVAKRVVEGLDERLRAHANEVFALSLVYNSERIPIRMTQALRGDLETHMLRNGYRMVERGEGFTDKLMDELALQHSATYDEGAATRVGKLMGAKGLIFGQVTNEYEHRITLQIKVASVETGEILASASVLIKNAPEFVRDALQPISRSE